MSQKKKTAKSNFNTPVQHQQIYAGPIPPASELAKLDGIHAGLADRVMSLAEEDAKHVRGYQRDHLKGAINRSEREDKATARGQWFAFIITICFLIFGFILVLLNRNITGTIFGSISLITALGSFIYMFFCRKEKQKKQQ